MKFITALIVDISILLTVLILLNLFSSGVIMIIAEDGTTTFQSVNKLRDILLTFTQFSVLILYLILPYKFFNKTFGFFLCGFVILNSSDFKSMNWSQSLLRSIILISIFALLILSNIYNYLFWISLILYLFINVIIYKFTNNKSIDDFLSKTIISESE
jgi:hypothetical protein